MALSVVAATVVGTVASRHGGGATRGSASAAEVPAAAAAAHVQGAGIGPGY